MVVAKPYLVVHVLDAGNNLADWVSRSLDDKLAHKLMLLRVRHHPLALHDDFLSLVKNAIEFSNQ